MPATIKASIFQPVELTALWRAESGFRIDAGEILATDEAGRLYVIDLNGRGTPIEVEPYNEPVGKRVTYTTAENAEQRESILRQIHDAGWRSQADICNAIEGEPGFVRCPTSRAAYAAAAEQLACLEKAGEIERKKDGSRWFVRRVQQAAAAE